MADNDCQLKHHENGNTSCGSGMLSWSCSTDWIGEETAFICTKDLGDVCNNCCFNNNDCNDDINWRCNDEDCTGGSKRTDSSSHPNDCRTTDSIDVYPWGLNCHDWAPTHCTGNCSYIHQPDNTAEHGFYDTPAGTAGTNGDAAASPYYCCTHTNAYENYTQLNPSVKSYWGPGSSDTGNFTARSPSGISNGMYSGLAEQAVAGYGITTGNSTYCKKWGISDALHRDTGNSAGQNWPYGSCRWKDCQGNATCKSPPPYAIAAGNQYGWETDPTTHNADCTPWIDACGVCRSSGWSPPSGYYEDGTIDCANTTPHNCATDTTICSANDCPERNACGECGDPFAGAPNAGYCQDQCGDYNPNGCSYPGSDATLYYIYDCSDACIDGDCPNTDFGDWNGDCFGCTMTNWGSDAGAIIDDGSCNQPTPSSSDVNRIYDIIRIPSMNGEKHSRNYRDDDGNLVENNWAHNYEWEWNKDWGDGYGDSTANRNLGPGNSAAAGWFGTGGGGGSDYISAKVYDSTISPSSIQGVIGTSTPTNITMVELVDEGTDHIYEDYHNCAGDLGIDFDSGSDYDVVQSSCPADAERTIHYHTTADNRNNIRHFEIVMPPKYTTDTDLAVYVTFSNNTTTFTRPVIIYKTDTELVIDGSDGSITTPENGFCCGDKNGLGSAAYYVGETTYDDSNGANAGWEGTKTSGTITNLRGGDKLYMSVAPKDCSMPEGGDTYDIKVWIGVQAKFGCTDYSAFNWNHEANVDDGSCSYGCGPGIGAEGGNLSPTHYNGNASAVFPAGDGSPYSADYPPAGWDHPASFLNVSWTHGNNFGCFDWSDGPAGQGFSGMKVKSSPDADCINSGWDRFRFRNILLPNVNQTYVLSYYYRGFSESQYTNRGWIRKCYDDGSSIEAGYSDSQCTALDYQWNIGGYNDVKLGTNPRTDSGWYYFEKEFDLGTGDCHLMTDEYGNEGCRWGFAQCYGQTTGAEIAHFRIRPKEENASLPLIECGIDENNTTYTDCPEGNNFDTGCVHTVCNLDPTQTPGSDGSGNFLGEWGYDWHGFGSDWDCNDTWSDCANMDHLIFGFPSQDGGYETNASNACQIYVGNSISDWIEFDGNYENYGQTAPSQCGRETLATNCDHFIPVEWDGVYNDYCLYGSFPNDLQVGGVSCPCASDEAGTSIGSSQAHIYTGRAPHYCCWDKTGTFTCDADWDTATLSTAISPSGNTNNFLSSEYGHTGYGNSVHCGSPSSCPGNKIFEADNDLSWTDATTGSHQDPMGSWHDTVTNLDVAKAYVETVSNSYSDLGQNKDVYGCTQVDGYAYYNGGAMALYEICNYDYSPSDTITIDDGTCIGDGYWAASVPSGAPYNGSYWSGYRNSGYVDTPGMNTHWKYGHESLPAGAGVRPHPVYNKYFPCTCVPCDTTDLIYDGDGNFNGYPDGYDFTNCPKKYYWDSDGDGIGCAQGVGGAPDPQWFCPGAPEINAGNGQYQPEWVEPEECIDSRCETTNRTCTHLADCLEVDENSCDCPNICDSSGDNPGGDGPCSDGCTCNCWIDEDEDCNGYWFDDDTFDKVACNDGAGNDGCPCNNAYHQIHPYDSDATPISGNLGTPSQVTKVGEPPNFTCLDRCGECSIPGCSQGCNRLEDACGKCWDSPNKGARCMGLKTNDYMTGVSIGEFDGGNSHPTGKGGCCRPPNWLDAEWYFSAWYNDGGVNVIDCHGVCFGQSTVDDCGNCTAQPGLQENATNVNRCKGNEIDGSFGTFDTAGINAITDADAQVSAPDDSVPAAQINATDWHPAMRCSEYETEYGYNPSEDCLYNWAVDSCGSCYGANNKVHGCCLDNIGDTITNTMTIRENQVLDDGDWQQFPESKFSFTEFELPEEKLVHHYTFNENYPYNMNVAYTENFYYMFDKKGNHIEIRNDASGTPTRGYSNCEYVSYWRTAADTNGNGIGGEWVVSNCNCDQAYVNSDCFQTDIDSNPTATVVSWSVTCRNHNDNLVQMHLMHRPTNLSEVFTDEYGGIWGEHAWTADQVCEKVGTFEYTENVPEHLDGHSLTFHSSHTGWGAGHGWASSTPSSTMDIYDYNFDEQSETILTLSGENGYTYGNSWTIEGWIKPQASPSVLDSSSGGSGEGMILALNYGKYIDCQGGTDCTWVESADKIYGDGSTSNLSFDNMLFLRIGNGNRTNGWASHAGGGGEMSDSFGKVGISFRRTAEDGTLNDYSGGHEFYNEWGPKVVNDLDNPWFHFSLIYEHNQDWIDTTDFTNNRKNSLSLFVDGQRVIGPVPCDTFLRTNLQINHEADSFDEESNSFFTQENNMAIKDLKMYRGTVYPADVRWKFDEENGTSTADSGYFGHRGADLYGQAFLTGDSLYLDGNPSSKSFAMERNYSMMTENLKDFTVMGWFKGTTDCGTWGDACYRGIWNGISAYNPFILGPSAGGTERHCENCPCDLTGNGNKNCGTQYHETYCPDGDGSYCDGDIKPDSALYDDKVSFIIHTSAGQGWEGPGYSGACSGLGYYQVPNPAEWNHFTGTVTEGRYIRLYANGELVRDCDLGANALTEYPITTDSTTAVIGARGSNIDNDGNPSDFSVWEASYYRGNIKDVRYYNTSLNINEIKRIVNNDVNILFDRENFSSNNPTGFTIKDVDTNGANLNYSFNDVNKLWEGYGTFSTGVEYKFLPPDAIGDNTGCTDMDACNFDEEAVIPDGSCEYPEFPNCSCDGIMQYDCNNQCNDITDEDNFAVDDECGVCNGDNTECAGCMDSNACNFDSDYTIACEYGNESDECCEYPEDGFNCSEVCTAGFDCNGECGGTAVIDCNGQCGGTDVPDECGICGGNNYFDENGYIIAGGSLPAGNCTCSEDGDMNTIDCSGFCGNPESNNFAVIDNCGHCQRLVTSVSNYGTYADNLLSGEKISSHQICTQILASCSLVNIDGREICYYENANLGPQRSEDMVPDWLFNVILYGHNFEIGEASNGIYSDGITLDLCNAISIGCTAVNPSESEIIASLNQIPCFIGYNGDYDDCGICYGDDDEGCEEGAEACGPNQQLVNGVCYDIADFNLDGSFDFTDLIYQIDYINYLNIGSVDFGTDTESLTEQDIPNLWSNDGDTKLNILDVLQMIKYMKDLGEAE